MPQVPRIYRQGIIPAQQIAIMPAQLVPQQVPNQSHPEARSQTAPAELHSVSPQKEAEVLEERQPEGASPKSDHAKSFSAGDTTPSSVSPDGKAKPSSDASTIESVSRNDTSEVPIITCTDEQPTGCGGGGTADLLDAVAALLSP